MKEIFRAVEKRKIAEDIIGQIKHLILRRQLTPGDRLPSERDLCEKLRVGRPAIREALRSLEMMGLIDVQQGKGSFVKEIDFNSYIEALRDNVSFTLLTDSVSLNEVYQGRKMIEPAIAHLVASHRTEKDMEILEGVIRDTRRALDDGRRFIKYAAVIHDEIARMTRNKVVWFSVNFLLTIGPLARLQRFSHKNFRQIVLDDHERIVDRIREQDGQGASREMERHMENLIRGFGKD